MNGRKPTKKYRRRERRTATRHGMSLEEWRAHLATRHNGTARRNAWKASREQPADQRATFRQAVR